MDARPHTLLPNPLGAGVGAPQSAPSWRPPIELFQHGEALFLQVELPGLTEADFEIGFANGCLCVRGQRRFRGQVPADARCFTEEIHYGPFRFELAIHPYFDASAMRREFVDGMLRIRIPRRDVGQRH